MKWTSAGAETETGDVEEQTFTELKGWTVSNISGACGISPRLRPSKDLAFFAAAACVHLRERARVPSSAF